MITKKYTEYILEKKIYELILEAKMVYSSEFNSIILDMYQSELNPIKKLAYTILQYMGKNVNVNDNYIDVGDNPGMIKFTPDDRANKDEVLYRLNPSTPCLAGDNNIVKDLARLYPAYGECSLQEPGLELNWKVIDSKRSELQPSFIFYLLEEIDKPNHKICVYSEPGNSTFLLPDTVKSNRSSEVRLGRFLNKFFSAVDVQASAQEIEKFVNVYQSYVLFRRNINDHLKIVDSEMIRYWYDEYNYANENGQLGNSCMRYEHCQEYLDIYCDNPEVCKLLVLTDEKKNLLGRALLWQTKTVKFMDRIYTCKDSYMPLFNKWANQNGYETQANKLTVEIKDKTYTLLPYMDTFAYYQPTEGLLHSSYPPVDGLPLYGLEGTDGTYLRLRN